ncbi:MAG: prenyltransferase/squalene oxidase repeat-containing protein [Chthoniobacteraceae bacterium]
MRTRSLVTRALALLIALVPAARAQEMVPRREEDLSVRNEVQIAIDRGLQWLRQHQNADGSWSLSQYPALTGLPLWAYMGNPEGAPAQKPDYIQKGYDFIVSSGQLDGGIYRKGLANYNTSICLIALVLARDPKYDPMIRVAHDFVIGQQAKNLPDPSLDGGIGYGPSGSARGHPDLSNTVFALEAIRRSQAIAEKENPNGPKLDWDAAIAFIQRCQNLPSVNKGSYVSTSPDDRGGFMYFPGDSSAGETGKGGARSYGSMSYAGLLSYIYADLSKTDPRVNAAVDWLKNHYSVDENPGMGIDGLYYYYQVMAKALLTYGAPELSLTNGTKVNWPKELGLKLINLQQDDGSWANDSGRWMEKDPVVATSYSVLTLEMVYHEL